MRKTKTTTYCELEDFLLLEQSRADSWQYMCKYQHLPAIHPETGKLVLALYSMINSKRAYSHKQQSDVKNNELIMLKSNNFFTYSTKIGHQTNVSVI